MNRCCRIAACKLQLLLSSLKTFTKAYTAIVISKTFKLLIFLESETILSYEYAN